MEKRERPNAETYQNIEELASGVQECRLAGVRSCGGGAHNKSSSTSASPGMVRLQHPQAPRRCHNQVRQPQLGRRPGVTQLRRQC